MGVLLELVRWETHTHPAFASDTQAAVNDQIGDEYDVFLGILWGRFGTPTPRASSGTEEEFLRALSRHRREGTPEIMIYFKDAPIQPSRMDLAQMQKVMTFKAGLSNLGGLYSTFEDMPSFETSLRSHLSAIAQRFSSRSGRADMPAASAPDRMLSGAAEIDDLGFLDYLEIYQARIADMTATMALLTDATVRIGEQVHQRAAEIDELPKPLTDMSAARRIMKRTAEDFRSYAESLAKYLPAFATARTEALHALSNGLATRPNPESNEDGVAELAEALKQMLATMRSTKESLAGFRNTAHSLPRLTADLNKAKRAAVTQLDSMLDEVDKTDSTVVNILEAISKMGVEAAVPLVSHVPTAD